MAIPETYYLSRNLRDYPNRVQTDLQAYYRLRDYFVGLRELRHEVIDAKTHMSPALISQKALSRDGILVVLTCRRYHNGASSEVSLVGREERAIVELRTQVNPILGFNLGDYIDRVNLMDLKTKVYLVTGTIDELLKMTS